jgi:hypothetical protein
MFDSLLVGRTEHAGRVDSVLLGKLPGALGNSSRVEDRLHGLKHILCCRCSCGVRVLLALHHYIHDLAHLHWEGIFGLHDAIDV